MKCILNYKATNVSLSYQSIISLKDSTDQMNFVSFCYKYQVFYKKKLENVLRKFRFVIIYVEKPGTIVRKVGLHQVKHDLLNIKL